MKFETLVGCVSYSPNHQSCKVRISVPQSSGCVSTHLALKATFPNFSRHDLEKGTWVEVTRTHPNDASKSEVTEIVAERKKDKTMTERVHFYLNAKYFEHDMLSSVLFKAFGIQLYTYHRIDRQGSGVNIVCRPAQFARFLIYRNEAGIKNGFMDLEVVLKKVEDDDV